ncbi:hypothetical protein FACS189413_04190 [Bacteroidia bacterium]|nr:hypothetical protein FACS189413_04190 [Bacteroidia bacterium]
MFTFYKAIFLPAAGNRNRNTGAMNNVGANGNYWSSSPTGTNSFNLNFNSGSINGANTNNRSNGLTVRCVAELNIETWVGWISCY